MLLQEKQIKLKDGRTAVLRSPREEDAKALVDYMRTTAEETDFLIRCPEECDLTEEQERQWIRGVRESGSCCAIVCEVDGQLAGNCEVRFHERIKLRHRGVIGIALLKAYWGLGIGSAMFEQMICIAKDREGVRQLELEFAEGNHRAKALYEKMGFAVVGFKPDAIRLKDGTMLKEFHMVKRL